MPGDPVPPGYRGAPLMMTAPDQHRRYLLARFGPAAEAWARANPAQVYLPGGMSPGPATAQEVEGYLAAGHGDAPTGLGGLLGTAHNPEVWHVDLVVQWLGAVAEQLTVSLLRPP
ncbi:hypothetical protein OHA72_39490 [Dactylosporangium sp. NBC_01737]|uniref:hypothetical protein n=1 Tax=Dactylosporangium sp. NBC_01737 TaxID=2975959 RepID=UPI002E0FB861|nr:hypothetical protein OHA72_39490 [Dactylosporangium sp. NBC_01737]